jgi:hypothetical protein
MFSAANLDSGIEEANQGQNYKADQAVQPAIGLGRSAGNSHSCFTEAEIDSRTERNTDYLNGFDSITFGKLKSPIQSWVILARQFIYA